MLGSETLAPLCVRSFCATDHTPDSFRNAALEEEYIKSRTFDVPESGYVVSLVITMTPADCQV